MTNRSSRLFMYALLGACCCVFTVGATPAEARSERTTRYRYDQIWPTAVRFLRVDAQYTILEKDLDTGYVLFEAKEEGKSFRGSLELIKLRDADGRTSVRMVIHIEDRPSYVEIGLLDRLERKLRDEYGSPREEPPRGKGDDDDKREGHDKDGDTSAEMAAHGWCVIDCRV